jgi:hypothetical protein
MYPQTQIINAFYHSHRSIMYIKHTLLQIELSQEPLSTPVITELTVKLFHRWLEG